MDDSLQPTIDMLLNLAVRARRSLSHSSPSPSTGVACRNALSIVDSFQVFLWFGAVCPWPDFLWNDVIPIYRLIPLGILILLLRRLPAVYAMRWSIRQIEGQRQALFMGFFGPIGVSAIFYLQISLQFLQEIPEEDPPRTDIARLKDVMSLVVWFLTICSIVRLRDEWGCSEVDQGNDRSCTASACL